MKVTITATARGTTALRDGTIIHFDPDRTDEPRCLSAEVDLVDARRIKELGWADFDEPGVDDDGEPGEPGSSTPTNPSSPPAKRKPGAKAGRRKPGARKAGGRAASKAAAPPAVAASPSAPDAAPSDAGDPEAGPTT